MEAVNKYNVKSNLNMLIGRKQQLSPHWYSPQPAECPTHSELCAAHPEVSSNTGHMAQELKTHQTR